MLDIKHDDKSDNHSHHYSEVLCTLKNFSSGLFAIMIRSFLSAVLVVCCVFAMEARKIGNPSFFAINSILNTKFASETGKVDFISCGARHGKSELLRDHLLRHKNELLSITIKICYD